MSNFNGLHEAFSKKMLSVNIHYSKERKSYFICAFIQI